MRRYLNTLETEEGLKGPLCPHSVLISKLLLLVVMDRAVRRKYDVGLPTLQSALKS
jgi:hypothetical protein